MLDIVLLTFASVNYFLKTFETKELQNCKTFKKEFVNCIILTGNHLSKWDHTLVFIIVMLGCITEIWFEKCLNRIIKTFCLFL